MTITRSLISLDAVNGFSNLLKSYIAGEPGLKNLYAFPPSPDGFGRMLATNPFQTTDRQLLAETIRSQYSLGGITPSSLADANIQKLKEKNTYTVCTGHQLCLFTGPLYFIYKLISAVNLAEALHQKHPDFNFVPVYWLASEDHDFEEVNHAHLFGKKLEWTRAEALKEVTAMPAGKINTASLDTVLGSLKTVLGVSDNALKLFFLVEDAYRGHTNLADATRCFVNALLGEYGLIILDANDSKLKSRFSGVMEDELLHTPNCALVQNGIAALEALGFSSQVNPREINLFYMKDDLRGRIEKTAVSQEYKILNTSLTFSKEEILAELKTHPERFSPNVVLRPLYQQMILPNLAYVGGPGELAYWLEYKAMFDRNKVVFPILVPRNFVMWVDANTSGKMGKLKQSVEGLSRNLSDVEKEYLESNISSGLKLDAESASLTTIYGNIVSKATLADPTLKAAAEGELQKTLNGLKNIEAKMMKAEKQQHETALNQIKSVKEKLYPGSVLQERFENFMPFYLKHGPLFFETLKAGLDPFESKMIVFTETE
jgi:bacillithiol biosynthesis cysteine-adding enzyme BshC